MIAIVPHAQGCVLSVRAQPNARRNGVLGEHAGALRLGVTAAPEKGRANKALVELLRDLLGVKRSQVELLSGETCHDKRFLVTGLSADELRSRITALLT